MSAMSDLTIRPFRSGDEPAVLALFNEVFAEDDPGFHPRSLAAWRWEFVDNPAGTQVVLGIEPSGRVVAQYACLPARANLRGEDVCCGQGIDSVVHRDYRRGLKREGAFLKVANYYFEHYGIPSVNAFGYGLPNSKAFRVGVRMLQYVPVAAPLRTVARNLFDTADDSAVGLGAATGTIVELPRCGPEVDALWRRVEPGHPMAIRRTPAYLNWRYADCPLAKYRIFAMRERDDLRALWVTRADWMGPPILAVCELVSAAGDDAALAAMLKHTVELARATGQQRVETWIPQHSPRFERAMAQGFFAEDSPFNLCLKIYRPDLDPDWARANWWYSIGDSDVF